MIHYITPTGIASAWVANEIEVMSKHGIPVMLHSIRPSAQRFFTSPWARELDAQTRVIYPVAPFSIVTAFLLAPFRFGARFFGALLNAIVGSRESMRNRVVAFGHFLVACHWAHRLRREKVDHIHSQWIHSGGTVGMYGAWLLDVGFSFTGHAADLFRERVALKDKVRRAEFIVCISEFHRQFFRDLGAKEHQLHTVYCGIDLTHFIPGDRRARAGAQVMILSSGRLVEKKGFAVLLEACAILRDRGVGFRCVIAGEGPQEKLLAERINALDLDGLVSLTSRPLTQEELPGFMQTGDVYALACVWAKDGDVDGLPQMLMEAMACGLPVVSTRLVGIPDLVAHGENGLLVESGNATDLADALARLIADERLAARLARAGTAAVHERFEINAALQPLIRLFRAKLKQRPHGVEPKSGNRADDRVPLQEVA